MRRARTTLIALAAGLSAGLPASCGMLDCVKGTGDPVTRTLTVADLHGIHVQGSVDVQLVPGATQQVSVEGQANIIDLLGSPRESARRHLISTSIPSAALSRCSRSRHHACNPASDGSGSNRK